MNTERIEKLCATLKAGEAAIVESGPNRLYLTNMHSSAGTVLLTRGAAYFFIDFRYYEKACEVVKGLKVKLADNLETQLAATLKRHDIKTLFVETSVTSVSRFKALGEKLGVTISNDDCFDKALLKMRSVKTAAEINLIKAAQKLTDDTFSYILNNIKAGRTEREIMLDMEFFMRREGADAVGFDFIVVSGKNSSLPHGVPTDKPIENGDFITMDFGAEVNGYRSDMTRTVAVGTVSDKQRLVYETVLKAQEAGINKIRAGVNCYSADRTARTLIDEAGFGGCFGHSLGHGVGIEIHEAPYLSMRSHDKLEVGNIVTVEPGIYIEGEFGVRIEDMVAVTNDGCENLTHSTKDLIIL